MAGVELDSTLGQLAQLRLAKVRPLWGKKTRRLPFLNWVVIRFP